MKSKIKLILVGLILSTLLSGCIGQAFDGGAPEMIFTFGSSGDAVRLDPADVTDGESIQRMDNIHEGLVMYKVGSIEIEPCLATDWDVSADKKTITFNLRKGVKFHHGFGEMTADDVVFSFVRQYDETNWYHDKGEWAYWHYMFTDVESVEKIDKYTVAIHLKRPNASMLTSLAMFTVCIVSEDAAKEYGDDYFKNPVGTGPFEFVRWEKDDYIELRSFKDYWRRPPSIDTLIFKVIDDPSARLMALQTGEVDGIEHIDPMQLQTIRDDPDLILISQAGMNVGYIALNCGEGYVDDNGNGKWDAGEEVDVPGVLETDGKRPFEDIRVRRAIAHAINKPSIVRNLYQGAASVAKEGQPPSLFGYNDDITGYEYDPDKARDLLEEAGYGDGFKVTLWHMGATSRPYFPVPTEIAEAIQADLAAIGIEVELFTEDWGTYLQDTEAGKHHMAMLGWTGDNGDPDNFLNVLYSQDKAVVGAAGNIAFKKNPEFQELLDEALTTYDQDKRAELYYEANKLLVDQCSHVFIAHADQNLAFRMEVQGYAIHPTSRKFFYPVWIEEGRDWNDIVKQYETYAHNFEEAEKWKEAAESWKKSAHIWERNEKREKAAESWLAVSRNFEAAALDFKEIGEKEQAFDYCIEAEVGLERAINLANQAGDPAWLTAKIQNRSTSFKITQDDIVKYIIKGIIEDILSENSISFEEIIIKSSQVRFEDGLDWELEIKADVDVTLKGKKCPKKKALDAIKKDIEKAIRDIAKIARFDPEDQEEKLDVKVKCKIDPKSKKPILSITVDAFYD
ncbi:MAG: ABC transporter substrate-binding protein [Candidatus Methanofastidiosia archaeon]|jgi:peptide/nickel transport system substrate-binding protein